MTDFKTIALSEIHPDQNQPRKFFDDHSLKELTESVKQKGVLQPIMVRPNGSGYILVCGERRFKASTAAGLTEVPAVIRNLTDEEALEIQFIENIQRDDVHPIDEASTFKAMLESKVKPYTVADIAAKINKPEKFVTHRLSLNNLIPELQQDFWKGKFLIGHAVLFSKLSAEDQKTCAKDCREWNSKDFKHINEVKEYISRNIMRVLSSAPFKKDDPTLNPEMGACTSCPFRSGNNPTLFDEVKETDRCFKPACFNVKLEEHAMRKMEEILSEGKEVSLLCNRHEKLLKKADQLAKQYNVKILKEYDDFNTYKAHDTPVKTKGMWINGRKIGDVDVIYIKGKPDATGDKKSPGIVNTTSHIDGEIEGIKQRTKRAAELDDEKVWSRIHKEILNDESTQIELFNAKPLSKIDTAAVLLAFYERAGSRSTDIMKLFDSKKENYYLGTKEKFALSKKMLEATPEQFNQACRIFALGVLDTAMGSQSSNAGQGLLRQMAEQHHKMDIDSFELEQKEKREKREVRAAQRIKALQDQKKQKVVKTTPPAAPPAKPISKTKKAKS